MGKPLVFCRRIEFLVRTAKQHGDSESERQQSGQEIWPGPLESEAPDDERGEDEQINEKPISHKPETAGLGFEFIPLLSNLRRIEALVHRLIDQSFPLGFCSLTKLPESLGHLRGKTWRRRLK